MNTTADSSAWLAPATGEPVRFVESCVIGRSRNCQVVIEDNRASRRHAMIHRQASGEFWLVDLGSANGTRVNDRRVLQPTRLFDRDRIEIAGSCFTFRQAGPASADVREISTVNATVVDIRKFDGWLLVADIIGSTQFIERLAAEASVDLTARWLSECRALIEGSGGAINKYLGDGFLAYWPRPSIEGQEVAAVLRELKRRQAVQSPPFRVAVHFGTIVSGGAPSLGEESLSGREVTFVFRMEDLASNIATPFLLSETAALQLRSLLATSEAGAYPMAGFTGSYRFFTF